MRMYFVVIREAPFFHALYARAITVHTSNIEYMSLVYLEAFDLSFNESVKCHLLLASYDAYGEWWAT